MDDKSFKGTFNLHSYMRTGHTPSADEDQVGPVVSNFKLSLVIT